MPEQNIVIYHRVMRHENFEKAAKDLVSLVFNAETQNPGKPRILYLDIDGHRNEQGVFDADMFELQKEFGTGFLLPFLTEIHLPLGVIKNKKLQKNDVPEYLEIFNANNEKDDSLERLCLKNYSNTEYQTEETVYAYLEKVSKFLNSYQELEMKYSLLPSEEYDPHNFLFQWRVHIRELCNELFNMFVTGNLFSAAAMTRTLMECYIYVRLLKEEKNPDLFEEWYLCGLIKSIPKNNEKGMNSVRELCEKWNKDPEEIIKCFEKGHENAWLHSLFPSNRISFFKICEYLNENELYKDYQWACTFVHGQDVRTKMNPFLFYSSIYYQLNIIMTYIFKAIQLFPVSEDIEDEIENLECELALLWGTTSWDKKE